MSRVRARPGRGRWSRVAGVAILAAGTLFLLLGASGSAGSDRAVTEAYYGDLSRSNLTGACDELAPDLIEALARVVARYATPQMLRDGLEGALHDPTIANCRLVFEYASNSYWAEVRRFNITSERDTGKTAHHRHGRTDLDLRAVEAHPHRGQDRLADHLAGKLAARLGADPANRLLSEPWEASRRCPPPVLRAGAVSSSTGRGGDRCDVLRENTG